MLKNTGPLLWIHDEQRDIAAMTFRFKDKESPRTYISSLVHSIHVTIKNLFWLTSNLRC